MHIAFCLLLLATVVLTWMRFTVNLPEGFDLTSGGIYKDIAHVFCGAMLGMGVLALALDRRVREKTVTLTVLREAVWNTGAFGIWCGVLGLFLILVELLAAGIKIFSG